MVKAVTLSRGKKIARSWVLRVAYWLLEKKPPPEELSAPVEVVAAVKGQLVTYAHFAGVPKGHKWKVDPQVKAWKYMSPCGDVTYVEPGGEGQIDIHYEIRPEDPEEGLQMTYTVRPGVKIA